MNLFSNYIQKKLITADHKDPPWMKEYIKRKIMNEKKIRVSLLILIKKIMPT